MAPRLSLDAFVASIEAGTRPDGLPPLLAAMWHERRGDWDRAHRLAQDVETVEGAWVHAYLHRREGDVGNAGYWYRRAGRPAAHGSLDEEWSEITTTLLGTASSG